MVVRNESMYVPNEYFLLERMMSVTKLYARFLRTRNLQVHQKFTFE